VAGLGSQTWGEFAARTPLLKCGFAHFCTGSAFVSAFTFKFPSPPGEGKGEVGPRYIRPDLVLVKHKTVVFVHGCFWQRFAAGDLMGRCLP
jgi:hypothetical protein